MKGYTIVIDHMSGAFYCLKKDQPRSARMQEVQDDRIHPSLSDDVQWINDANKKVPFSHKTLLIETKADEDDDDNDIKIEDRVMNCGCRTGVAGCNIF